MHNIDAQTLADAARWRKLCVMVDKVPNGMIVCEADDNFGKKYTVRVLEDPMIDPVGIDNGYGVTLSEAIDNIG